MQLRFFCSNLRYYLERYEIIFPLVSFAAIALSRMKNDVRLQQE